MNQTRKNLLSYSNSAIHSLKLVKNAHLKKSSIAEFIYMMASTVNPYLTHHKIHVKLPKSWNNKHVLGTSTPKCFNDYLTFLVRVVTDAQHNHVKLSEKTEFVVKLSDRLDSFNLYHNIDPNLLKISHMSTAELAKRIKDCDKY